MSDSSLGGNTLDAWRTWLADELSQSPDKVAADTEPTTSEEDQAAVIELGRSEGFRQGLEQGYQAGFNEGRDEGHAQGLAEGLREAEEQLQQRLREQAADLTLLAQNFAHALRQLDKQIASELVELALVTGRQLARNTLDADPGIVLQLVRELLKQDPVLGAKPQLWLHSADLALVRAAMADELKAAGWSLHSDDELTRGGCRVSSPQGEFDSTWETRWQAISNQIRQRHAHPTAPLSAEDDA